MAYAIDWRGFSAPEKKYARLGGHISCCGSCTSNRVVSPSYDWLRGEATVFQTVRQAYIFLTEAFLEDFFFVFRLAAFFLAFFLAFFFTLRFAFFFAAFFFAAFFFAGFFFAALRFGAAFFFDAFLLDFFLVAMVFSVSGTRR